MSNSLVRVLNLKQFTYGNLEERRAFAEAFAASLKETGFITLEGHGIDPNLIAKTYALYEQLFAKDIETKRKYVSAVGGQRGYTEFGKEHAKNRTVGDLKEFWHVGQELPVGHAFYNSADYPPNIWVDEMPEMRTTALSLYRELERVARNMLEALAMHFDLRQDFFKDMIKEGNSVLRAIHYPPLEEGMDPEAVRAAAHEDINLITLLCEATSSGLELLTRDGQWYPVEALKGQIVVDAGDMLQRITNGVIPSTTHRVVNPKGENKERYSMPFFVHPYSDYLLETIPSCVSEENPQKWEDITAGDFLHERLVEIGLVKKK
jgi:isopenicillin N synthase-like dioxygenase